MTRIKLVQGDTRPQIRVTLSDQDSGAPIDLTGCSVYMHFRPLAGDLLFSRTGYVNPATAEQGIVVFTFSEGDLDVDAGEYEGEFEVYNPTTGFRQTAFEVQKFRLRADFA